AYYYQRKLKLSDLEFNVFCEQRMEESARHSAPHRKAISDLCRERGIVLASHDAATIAPVDEAVEQGTHVAEFPAPVEEAPASEQDGAAV
ncbi:hypothetical protein J8J17_22990, partial [Mycobacterium tuberculosis]|nr:hypothetical protein [Mycobacterium tuberculosis]